MSNKYTGISFGSRRDEEEEAEDNFPTPTRPLFQDTSQKPNVRENYGLKVPSNSSGYSESPPKVAQPSLILDIFSSEKDSKTGTSVEEKSISAEDLEALEMWKRVTNFDRFLEQLYQYYYGKGFANIVVNRTSTLLIMAFVVVFSMILLYCVDWALLGKPATEVSHPKLSDVLHFSNLFNMSFFMYICFMVFLAIWSWQSYLLFKDIPRLKQMKCFFNRILLINDNSLPNYEFNIIVNKLVALQQRFPISSDPFNACDIANRIMRRENYLIALFNKDIMDLSLPIPFANREALTKTLEWNLSFSILSYVFDENLMVKKSFLKDVNRTNMAEGLRKRFQLMAIVNLILSPFILVFLLLHFIFKYGEEIYKNPKVIGNREYTPYARWKLREFNELPHYFDKRLAISHRKAIKYMEQFHNIRLAGLTRMPGFIIGSLCLVMILLTVYNEDLLMHFEITPGKSIIWYLAAFGAALALTRSFSPDPTRLKDPSKLMQEVAEHTHYMPNHWKNRLESETVRSEFGEHYQYQMLIFLNELASVILTPFILWYSLPKSAEKIVEFFREFTVHVDRIGYVCSFALFDFKRHGNPKYGSTMGPKQNASDKYLRSKQGKMEKSFISFAANYPDWVPGEQGSMYLGKLREFDLAQSQMAGRQSHFFKSKASVYKQGECPYESIRDSEGDLQESQGLMALLNEYYDHNKLDLH